jgi:hypothetical protein
MNKESLELAIFIAETTNGVEKSRRDDKITWTDALNFLNAAMTAPDAFNGIAKVGEEFKSWTPEEKDAVVTAFTSRLKFENEVTQVDVEAVFAAAIELAKAIDILVSKKRV